MRLQKNTSLALYSVLEFARTPERRIAAAEIAEKYDTSSRCPKISAAVLPRRQPRSRGQSRPVEAALGLVLSEIDENAKATFKSITQATILRLIERRKAGADSPQGPR